jgi:hypothetical protein
MVNRVAALEATVIRLHSDMTSVLVELGKIIEMVKERQLYGDNENDRA